MVEKGVSECKAEGTRWRKVRGAGRRGPVCVLHSGPPCLASRVHLWSPLFLGFLFSLFAWLTPLRS